MGLGSFGNDELPGGGNGYSNLFAFGSNGVPTMGVGECRGIACNKFISGMIVVGGLVLERYDGFINKSF